MRVDDATQERELVAGEQRGKDQREAVGSWTGAEGVGGWRAERQAAEDSWWQESREGVGGWRAERQAAEEKLAWKNGGAVNTRHRVEKRGSIR